MSAFLLVFDLDGTLVDSVPDLRAALNQMLGERGRRSLSSPQVKRMVGDGVPALVARALAKDPRERQASAMVLLWEARRVLQDLASAAAAGRAAATFSCGGARLMMLENSMVTGLGAERWNVVVMGSGEPSVMV